MHLSQNLHIRYVHLSSNLHIDYVHLSSNLDTYYVQIKPSFNQTDKMHPLWSGQASQVALINVGELLGEEKLWLTNS